MINAAKRKNAFVKLGLILSDYCGNNQSLCGNNEPFKKLLEEAIEQSCLHNPWFTTNNIMKAVSALGKSLCEDELNLWLAKYEREISKPAKPLTVGVVMAGNIPMVGFHDMLCVLMSGHKLSAKLSGDDRFLLPAIFDILAAIEPEFKNHVTFTTDQLHMFDAVIATGSNNSARYFEYYFRNYPHIIRKNRNGIAILSGSETHEQLISLGDDVFSYFGLGCRNVSKLFIPKGYSIPSLLVAWESYSYLSNHSRYMNNYTYRKNVYLINTIEHYDNGFVLLLPSDSFSAPIGVVNYSWYNPGFEWQPYLDANRTLIQCVAAGEMDHPLHTDFGKTQQPRLWDYADGVDTMGFLLSLS
jgi:hypothetical protein